MVDVLVSASFFLLLNITGLQESVMLDFTVAGVVDVPFRTEELYLSWMQERESKYAFLPPCSPMLTMLAG